VAILGSESFDVDEIDVTTLVFGRAGAASVHEDLVSWYQKRATGISAGDTEACVTGELRDGIPFEGCDEIHPVPKPRPRPRSHHSPR
jgi:hypothetical protein